MNKRILQMNAVLLGMSLVLLCGLYQQRLYGNRKIVEFPFEMIAGLPEEPNWYEENAFDYDHIIGYQKDQREIQRWFDDIYSHGIDIVNKSGDPIPLKDFAFGSMFGVTFYQNHGNLVALSSFSYTGLYRLEIFENSIVDKGVRYCCIKEKIVSEIDKYFIDYENNNTLYYFVNDGTPKIIKIDEEVSLLDGYYGHFPILEKDGEIYSYILEGAEVWLPGKYNYEVKDISIKKVNILELTGICEIENIGGIQGLRLEQDQPMILSMYLPCLFEEGQYDVQEIFSLCKNDFIKEKPREKSYIYLNRTSGYDDDVFW